MSQKQIVRLDLIIQLTGISLLVGMIVLVFEHSNRLHWLLFILVPLVIWQFLSGIYTAVEFKRWYRIVLPGALLVLVTICILLAAARWITDTLLISLCLFPLILIANVVLAVVDWYQICHAPKIMGRQPGPDQILDAEEIFP
jgi:peptidoglycan/LPS O-acetylase OafA/YrhL